MSNPFADLQAEMKALREQMRERGKQLFREGSRKLFEDHPDLVSFSWAQYTPYFNDGDQCVFGVNDYSVEVELKDGTTVSAYEYSFEPTEDQQVVAQAACDLVCAIPEEVMKDVFGDHAWVTVYPDRVDVEEYEHD